MTIYPAKEIGYILHEQADQYYGQGTGFLSIKSFWHGEAHYASGPVHHRVNDDAYLILNHDQPYTIQIEAQTPVESFCIFFAPEFSRRVSQSQAETLEQALAAGPERAGGDEPAFFDRTYSHDLLVSPALFRLRQACLTRKPETGWLVEQFHDLFKLLLQVHHQARQEMEALPAARPATRQELYRRLYYAKDYADAFYAAPITITEMAQVAGLSTNHLLRMFRQVFHQSPYQYITARRLKQAQALLRQTDQSVTDICLAVGFKSLGSFSWLFRRKVGLSPQAYRLQTR